MYLVSSLYVFRSDWDWLGILWFAGFPAPPFPCLGLFLHSRSMVRWLGGERTYDHLDAEAILAAQVQPIGRWLSDIMFRYLSVQHAPLCADIAARMVAGGTFDTPPGPSAADKRLPSFPPPATSPLMRRSSLNLTHKHSLSPSRPAHCRFHRTRYPPVHCYGAVDFNMFSREHIWTIWRGLRS